MKASVPLIRTLSWRAPLLLLREGGFRNGIRSCCNLATGVCGYKPRENPRSVAVCSQIRYSRIQNLLKSTTAACSLAFWIIQDLKRWLSLVFARALPTDGCDATSGG